MLKKISYKNTTIRYDDGGDGIPLVFLHGYLESLNIWDDFVCKLSEKFRIIAIDIPGHGESGIIDEIHTMEQMADVVKYVLNALKIEKCLLIGHSMGGYVTLAFLEKYPEMLYGFCLFHSKPQADTEAVKLNRMREIELIREGKKNDIINTNIPKAFATENIEKFHEELTYSKKIALQTQNEGIIALLKGMMIRKNREEVLKDTNIPFLYILGKKDNYIPYEIIIKSTKLPKHTTILTLENSGHMGFFEEKIKCQHAISDFIDKCF
jgi:pimeloyl-ACP methyl ester carboxylesterase